MKWFIGEMFYPPAIKAGDYCILLFLTCQLHCIQLCLTVRRRHMASFPSLSSVYWLQGNSWLEVKFLCELGACGSFLPSPTSPSKQSASQVAANCNLPPVKTAGNGFEQRRFQPRALQETFLQGHLSCQLKFVPECYRHSCGFSKWVCTKVRFESSWVDGVPMAPKDFSLETRATCTFLVLLFSCFCCCSQVQRAACLEW